MSVLIFFLVVTAGLVALFSRASSRKDVGQLDAQMINQIIQQTIQGMVFAALIRTVPFIVILLALAFWLGGSFDYGAKEISLNKMGDNAYALVYGKKPDSYNNVAQGEIRQPTTQTSAKETGEALQNAAPTPGAGQGLDFVEHYVTVVVFHEYEGVKKWETYLAKRHRNSALAGRLFRLSRYNTLPVGLAPYSLKFGASCDTFEAAQAQQNALQAAMRKNGILLHKYVRIVKIRGEYHI